MTAETKPIIEVEEPEPGSKSFSVEVPESALASEMEKEFRELEKSARLPGFRKGKAPRHLLEARFRSTVREEAVEKLVSRVIWEALREAETVPFLDPVLDELSAPEGAPVRFRFSVDAWPRVEIRRHQGFELRRVVRPVTDQEMEQETRALQEANRNFVPVERPAIRGDQLLVSYQRFLPNGNAFGKRADGAELLLAREESPGVPGAVEKGLVGAEPGSRRTVPVDFPEDHPSAAFAGKKIEFRFEVKEVREATLPAVDDAFAARVLGREAAVSDLKDEIRKVLEQRAEEEADRKLDEEIIDLLVRENVVEVSGRLLEKVTRANLPSLPRVEDLPEEQRAEGARRITAVIDQHRAGAKRAIQKLALMTEIAGREKLEPEEREIETMRRAIAPREDPSLPPEERREKREKLASDLRRVLRERKVLQWIKEHSTVA
ncbi:MAG: trigger factor [Candidatus Eisenbacteria bacterium]